MQRNRLYHELAHLWPLVSPPEDYAEESQQWREVLRTHLGPGRHEVLELGVGGGHNLSHLTADFQATAVDLSEDMLALSRKLNLGVEHHQGDMRTVRLGRTFRAVLIHDAIAYMLTEVDLRAAIATARAHLESGGILILAPDWFKDTFGGTAVLHWITARDDLELTTIEYLHDIDPKDTTIESILFYIIRQGEQVHVEQDYHVTGLFPLSTWLELMREAGFVAEVLTYQPFDAGYGGYMLVGTLP